MDEYNIILFKNKQKYKLFKNYKQYSKAEAFYNALKSKNNVRFKVSTENGCKVKYEVAIVQKKKPNELELFVSDDLGRNIKIETTNKEYSIVAISEFKIAEKIYHYGTKKKYTFEQFLSKFLKKDKHYLISGLNNKFVVQENDNLELFILKTEEDTSNLFTALTDYMLETNNANAIIVKDISTLQRKFLYNLLVERGFNKQMLYSKHTTSPNRKKLSINK